jgi:hypothetical protein
MFEHMDCPSIDQVLDAFGRDDSIARHPATTRRSADTRTRLLAYLATDAERVLLPDEQALLTAERQFAPDGAFTRVFGADVLVATLPAFLEPAWLPRHPYDARAQVRFVELLCDWVVAHGLIDAGEMSCIIYGVLDSAREARAALGTARRELDPPLGDATSAPMRSATGSAAPAYELAATLPDPTSASPSGSPQPDPTVGSGPGSTVGSADDCRTPRRRGPKRSAGQGA